MSRRRQFFTASSLALGSLAWVLGGAGCSGKKSPGEKADGGESAGTSATTTAGAGGDSLTGSGGLASSTSRGGETVVLPNASSGTGGTAGFEECSGTVSDGKLAPLDMFIMLDSSGSMIEPAADGAEKWGSVQQALVSFLSDPGSDGLGVGIQYYPQKKPNAPDSCTRDSECPGDTGPCFQSLCAYVPAPYLVACSTNDDCRFTVDDAIADLGPCVTLGTCEDDGLVCAPRGARCGNGPAGPILCVQTATYCLNATNCAVSAYQTPAVPIAELPGAAEALIESIEGHEPVGQTPTGPALRGAIEQGRAWARAHPDHAVVAVLATDGMPTECTPTDIPEIAALASAALAGRPSIHTFVIGVFGPQDVDAQQNLYDIAKAGGSEQAFIVDTSRDVTTQFLAALDAIRTTRLACEFQIPDPGEGQTLDYNLVNVQFTNAGKTTPLYFVGHSAASCDASGGWYYDSDPSVEAPSRIIMCPSTCQTIEAARESRVEIQLGCRIRIR